MKQSSIILWLLPLCLLAGCRSASNQDQIQREMAELRGARDREVADMTGQPVPPPLTPTVEPAPAVMPEAKGAVPEEATRKRAKPDWVGTGFGGQWPLSRYIVGAGSCRKVKGRDYESLIVAEDRARDALARNIRVHIQSEYRSAAKLITEMRTGKTEVEADTTTVAEEITSSTAIRLDGVQIVDRWFDAEENAYWAFAALDRTVAGANLLDRIAQLRRDVLEHHGLAKKFRAQGSAFLALKHYRRARFAALAMLAQRAQLRVIAPAMAPAAAAIEKDTQLAELWRDAALAAKELRMAVLVFSHDDNASRLNEQYRAVLLEALRKYDLNFTAATVNPAVEFRTLRRMDPSELKAALGDKVNAAVLAELGTRYDGAQKLGATTLHFYKARGEALMVDLAENAAVAEASFDYLAETHSGHRNKPQAEHAAVERAAEELGRRMAAQLDAAFSGD